MSTGLKIFITVITLAGVAIMLFFIFGVMLSGNKLSVEETTIVIGGIYSKNIKMNSIENLSVTETPPDFSERVNGGSMGDLRVGYFLLENKEKVYVYIENYSTPPFINFDYDGESMIINLKTSEETKNLYDEISKNLNN
ncbi:MAG: hypothetical protein PWQ77_2178 [Kosmotogales bacterium]|nr:hypothetical protein [Kosmotogales bacterium]